MRQESPPLIISPRGHLRKFIYSFILVHTHNAGLILIAEQEDKELIGHPGVFSIPLLEIVFPVFRAPAAPGVA